MAKVVRLKEVHSVKAGPNSTVLLDGTIENPESYEAVDIEFDDGLCCQVERPLTVAKVKAAKDAAEDVVDVTIDEVSTGDTI